MSWWSGVHTNSIRDRFIVWDSYDKLREMQLLLLKSGAKKARWWSLLYQGVLCPCAKENNGVPQNPHYLCYGTGVLGGYHLFGTYEWMITRDFVTGSNGLMAIDINKGVVINTGGTISDNQIVSDWIDAQGYRSTGFVQAQYDLYRDNAGKVEFTTSGDAWQDALYFPCSSFRVRVTGQDVVSRFRYLRLRVFERDDAWVYLSETPPLRLEQIFRWGIDTQPFDVRVWTIMDGDAVLKTGDIIEWLEGAWTGMRYTVVNNKISQMPLLEDTFRPSVVAFKVLSQVLSMRKVKASEQDAQVW